MGDYAVRGLRGIEESPYVRDAGYQSLTTFQLDQLIVSPGLKWGYFPVRKFLHYTSPPRFRTYEHEGSAVVEQVVVGQRIHIWPPDPELAMVHLWHHSVGSPDARAVFACLMGFWHSASPPPVSPSWRD